MVIPRPVRQYRRMAPKEGLAGVATPAVEERPELIVGCSVSSNPW